MGDLRPVRRCKSEITGRRNPNMGLPFGFQAEFCLILITRKSYCCVSHRSPSGWCVLNCPLGIREIYWYICCLYYDTGLTCIRNSCTICRYLIRKCYWLISRALYCHIFIPPLSICSYWTVQVLTEVYCWATYWRGMLYWYCTRFWHRSG